MIATDKSISLWVKAISCILLNLKADANTVLWFSLMRRCFLCVHWSCLNPKQRHLLKNRWQQTIGGRYNVQMSTKHPTCRLSAEAKILQMSLNCRKSIAAAHTVRDPTEVRIGGNSSAQCSVFMGGVRGFMAVISWSGNRRGHQRPILPLEAPQAFGWIESLTNTVLFPRVWCIQSLREMLCGDRL